PDHHHGGSRRRPDRARDHRPDRPAQPGRSPAQAVDRRGFPPDSAGERLMPVDLTKITAIDVHVHAEVSCHDPEDPVMAQFFDAASAYFKVPRERPKMPEIAELYREQNIAFCLFTVDCESALGARRVSNYEIAEFAANNDDICIPFASIDPHKGKLGAREARDLIENFGVRGF